MELKTVGYRLTGLRGARTQEEVSSAVGISKSALAAYESGSRLPRDEIKVKLAHYYKKSVRYIFFDSSDT